ncbi:MAG TPA: tetratricopeptide repeat protein [Humidesulfovibrio sp.]|uniref:tetratricopeptide repeat protein n=1 Tax=Humidesulfovibrio sp. TaxID=2910988 RepID=UPI002B9AA82D|nr:tetratricopeptide repeat protein [Humidesulfovibrio sp.]HWR05144.1 tetratricopeptide repeat protein [Humidesulfovibrio sp.]
MTAIKDDSLRKMIIALLAFGVLAIFLTAFINGAGAPPAKERGAAARQDAEMSDAVAPLMARLQDDPNDKEAVSGLAHIFTKSENWEKAAPFWSKLVAAEPENIGSRYHYGFALSQLNRFPEAVEQYEAILKADPKDSAAHYYLGMINKYGLKKQDVAKKHFQQALGGNPDDRELAAEIKKELASMKQ